MAEISVQACLNEHHLDLSWTYFAILELKIEGYVQLSSIAYLQLYLELTMNASINMATANMLKKWSIM